jgi:surface polysaccharide O-acyltransferase-like enzyme
LNFAVPAFLFISGYWLSQKSIKSWGDYKSFLKRRFSRILVPYLFWSLVFLGYEACKAHEVSIVRILSKLLIGGASHHFYFIIVIAQLYLLTPILQYLNRKPYGFVSVLIFNIVTLLVWYVYSRDDLWFVEDPHCLIHSPFLFWIIFYQIGLLVGSDDNEGFVLQNFHFLILFAVLVSLAVSWLEAIAISYYDNWLRAICALKYSSFVYSTCIIFGFLALRERLKRWPKVLIALGNYSFGIYLIHMIFIRGIAKVIRRIDAVYSFQVLNQFIVVLITLITCCVLITAAQRLLPKPFYKKVLGF